MMLHLLLTCSTAAIPTIHVDQFGWRPDDTKVAIFADPQKGQNAGAAFNPSSAFEVRDAKDDRVVFRGRLSVWQNGAVSDLTGDRVWHADFSPVRTSGTYFVTDPKSGARSFKFRIGEDVFADVLVDAARTFYYQRAGTPITKQFGGAWNHPGGHLGKGQDKEAQYSQDGKGLGGSRDVSGGWYDAGDPNKYVPFLETTMFNLLWAYDRNPQAFGDATNIPESGNGTPDILDECRWELEWLLKMQDRDGGVFNRNGNRTYSAPPGPWSVDTQERFYTGKTTWATAIAAASFAHAARTFQPFDRAFAGTMRAAAERAWGYLEKHPKMEPSDGKDGDKLAAADGGCSANGDVRHRIYAAAELFKTTADGKYSTFVSRNAPDIANTNENGMHPLSNHVVDALNHMSLTQALFVYAGTPEANATVVRDFKLAVHNSAEQIRLATGGKDDPYLCYTLPDHYCWGSNQGKGYWARILVMAADLNVEPSRSAEYLSIAEGYVHYLHGRNALSWCYLTNMAKDGASRSVMRPYHKWFGTMPVGSDGQRPAPAPGFLVGGPNKAFSVSWIAPPFGEPPMKAYKDWDLAWNTDRNANEASWEITEPAIYYQASYISIAACFATKAKFHP